MTREEFVATCAYITAGCGKSLSSESLVVYFDLLGDLDVNTFRLAAKRVLLEHRWATFPSVAELREAAAETERRVLKELSAAEAWEMAWGVVKRTDPEVDGSFARNARGLPPRVVEAINAYGLPSLCCGGEPVGVVRGQFMKIYDQLAARDKRVSTMPAAIREAVSGVGSLPEGGRRSTPAELRRHVEAIGKMDKE